MKLAEALQIRKDLQRKVEDLKQRLSSNATVQEGEQPAENPRDLLKQLDDAVDQLERLIGKINETNSHAQKDGRTLTELLAQRDILKLSLNVYRTFLSDASQLSQRVRGSEIKIKSTVPVAELQKIVDQKSQELRVLELSIQELNWLSELEE